MVVASVAPIWFLAFLASYATPTESIAAPSENVPVPEPDELVHRVLANQLIGPMGKIHSIPGCSDNATLADPLFLLIRESDVNVLQHVVQMGTDLVNVNIKAADANGMTPLHVAAACGQPQAARLLLEHGADPNSTTRDNHSTPLHYACDYDNCFEVVHVLLQHGADVHAENASGSACLFQACEFGTLGVEGVGMLFAHGAKSSIQNNQGMTPLHLAACKGHTDIVRFLLAQTPSIVDTENEPFSPLHVAGDCEIVQMLIEGGANINALDQHDCTPLYMASNEGNLDKVTLLVEAGANIVIPCVDTTISIEKALSNQHVEIAQLLMKSLADNFPSSIDPDVAQQLFLYSSQMGPAELVGKLADEGNVDMKARVAKLNQPGEVPDTDCFQPLHYACLNGLVDVVKVMLSKGADANVTFADDCAPLHIACQQGHVNVVRALLSHDGIRIEAPLSDGRTPLHRAAYKGHTEVVELLLTWKSPAHANAKDENGKTALHSACQWKHVRIVELLLKHGADPEAATFDTKSLPMHSLFAGGLYSNDAGEEEEDGAGEKISKMLNLACGRPADECFVLPEGFQKDMLNALSPTPPGLSATTVQPGGADQPCGCTIM